jgi:hypothetical protein
MVSSTNSSNISTSGDTDNDTAIIGGIIGVGVLCLILFGMLIVKKMRRKPVDYRRRRSTRKSRWRFHANTEMQTNGLHEKDGTRISRFEKNGTPVHKKKDNRLMRREDNDEGGPVFELSAETRV